jgi:hypothetical protein
MFASMRYGARKVKKGLDKGATMVKFALLAWRLMTLLSPGNQTNSPGQCAFSVAATMRNEAF